MLTDVYIVIVEDRHSELDIIVFSTREAADAAIDSLLDDYLPIDAFQEPLNDAMLSDGWLRYVVYSSEGDNIRLLKLRLH
jgi:hypothetical protein